MRLCVCVEKKNDSIRIRKKFQVESFFSSGSMSTLKILPNVNSCSVSSQTPAVVVVGYPRENYWLEPPLRCMALLASLLLILLVETNDRVAVLTSTFVSRQSVRQQVLRGGSSHRKHSCCLISGSCALHRFRSRKIRHGRGVGLSAPH